MRSLRTHVFKMASSSRAKKAKKKRLALRGSKKCNQSSDASVRVEESVDSNEPCNATPSE